MRSCLSATLQIGDALGASEKDVIVGVLYLGKVTAAGKEKEPDPEGVVAEWKGLPQSKAPPP